jgi:radical SAM superfamily enzyme YgiQ (UPF0313 family)
MSLQYKVLVGAAPCHLRAWTSRQREVVAPARDAHSSGIDGGHEPLLAADQVLTVLHVTSLPDEAGRHADTIFIGPGEDTFPTFLRDLAAGTPQRRYASSVRTLEGLPPIRRDLIQRHRYLVPNSIVVSRGCPHHCTFCYKDGFFSAS